MRLRQIADPRRKQSLSQRGGGNLGAMALAADGFDTHVYSREPAGSPKAKLVESFGGRYV